MKIKELVEVALKNPDLMEMELSMVIQPHEQKGGILDGARAVLLNPVKTAMFGGDGLMLFADPTITKSVAFVPESAPFLSKTCIGPVPDWLK